MHLRVGLGRRWRWALRLLAVAVIVQACGGGSKVTGPTGNTQVHLTFSGLETAELPQTCTGTLSVTGPGMSPVSAQIPSSGVLSLPIPAGLSRTFTVTLACVKTDGTRTFTGQQVADVIAGQTVNLAIRVAVNQPPRVSASCSPSSVNVSVPSACSCTGSDPDPGDRLSFSWSATGGNLSSTTGTSTQFSSATPGTFDLTCAVSDGKATSTATTQVTVGGAAPPPPTTQPTLAVTVVGSGTATSSPSGISCPGTCSATSFAPKTVVSLTATPAAGQQFSGWGGACSGTGACSVTMPASGTVSVTASFVVQPVLSVTVVGSGTVTSSPGGISCPGTCSAAFAPNTSVTLTATPAAGFTFASWSACSGTGACSVTMPASGTVSVTATFTAVVLPTLSVTIAGSGTVTSSPGGINCPGTCSAPFAPNTVVALTVAPAAGQTFGGWSGPGSGTCFANFNCSVIMPASGTVSVTASFLAGDLLTVTISETSSPFGSTVTSTPGGISCTSTGTSTTTGTCSALFPHGSSVTLSATAGSGSAFINWGGACPVSFFPTCTITITGPTSVTASFF